MDSLTDTQREALAQIRDLTNGGDDGVSIDVLKSVGWDVQSAAELLFGHATTGTSTQSTASPTPPPRMERFEIDDTEQGADPRPRSSSSTPSTWTLIPRPLLSVLAFPFHLVSSLFRFIFNILRLPIPQFNLLNIYTRRTRRPTSREGRDRWIRELEEETGAMCISRYRSTVGAVASGAEAGPGPSTITARGQAENMWAEGRKLLPDFYQGTYEEALRLCQTESRIACAILVSEEHDDVAEFKRSTLTDPAFVRRLHDNNILVWGGDVRDQEAWSAAEKLQATTYPFVAFIALQPRRGLSLTDSRSSSTAAPLLTVLSRHQGRCIPASAPTSAATLAEHLDRQVLPRVGPFLERLRSAQREREHDRMLRDEQDRAFQEAARRDKERIETRMREDREREARRRAAEEEAAIAEAQRMSAAEARARWEERRMAVRRWTRRGIVGAAGNAGKLRVAVRMPDGSRVIKAFDDAATLTSLYAHIDAAMIPPNMKPTDDPTSAPSGMGSGESGLESEISSSDMPSEEWWGFKVVLAYPRKEVPWRAGARLADVDGLRGGGQVVVEMVGNSQQRPKTGDAEADDGYDTESSDD